MDEEISGPEASNLTFPSRLKKLTANIPICKHSRFPLIHSDFASWDVVMNDNYNILRVID